MNYNDQVKEVTDTLTEAVKAQRDKLNDFDAASAKLSDKRKAHGEIQTKLDELKNSQATLDKTDPKAVQELSTRNAQSEISAVQIQHLEKMYQDKYNDVLAQWASVKSGLYGLQNLVQLKLSEKARALIDDNFERNPYVNGNLVKTFYKPLKHLTTKLSFITGQAVTGKHDKPDVHVQQVKDVLGEVEGLGQWASSLK